MQHYFISTKHPKRYSLKIVEEIIKSIPVVIQENNLRIRKRMKKKNILDPEKTFLMVLWSRIFWLEPEPKTFASATAPAPTVIHKSWAWVNFY